MNNYKTLEDELENRATTSGDQDAKDFWHRYESMKKYLQNNYYPWIQSNCPYFTDHGEKHIMSVIQTSSGILSKYLNSNGNKNLSSLDIFLVLTGIIWHDAGMVYDRTNHEKNVGTIIKKIKEMGFPNPDIHRLVVEIVRAHKGKEGLNIPRFEEDCSTNNKIRTVSPRALAAIVRFADEISENRTRISPEILPSVPTEKKIFWEYANCISASRADPERERAVITINAQADAIIKKFKCPVEYEKHKDKEGNISLIEYIICRLEKMNNERIYCSSRFSKFVSIREIEARFTIFRGTDCIKDYENFIVIFGDSGLDGLQYPDTKIYDKFFDTYPNWKPTYLNEVMNRG